MPTDRRDGGDPSTETPFSGNSSLGQINSECYLGQVGYLEGGHKPTESQI